MSAPAENHFETSPQIPLARPWVGEAELRQLAEVLDSGRLALGPKTDAFEAGVAKLAGRRYGVAVNSGTSGLHLCVRALGIGPGDEVITTAFTFVATVNCILYEGATPVFVDIDPVSGNMDPDAIEGAVTGRTKAILPVEVFGNVAHFDAYETIAEKHGLAMIEDCCEALGGKLLGRPAGSFGDCGVFAFYPNKQLTCGEGGMIVTDSPEVRDKCVSMRNQGRDPGTDWLNHDRLGYNYRLSELQAAVGLAQLGRLGEILAGRRRVAEWYQAALSRLEPVEAPPCPSPQAGEASWFVYVIRLREDLAGSRRDAIVEHLGSAGVQCGVYFPPVHQLQHVKEATQGRKFDLPATEALAGRTLALPFHPQMREETVELVVSRLEEALQHCL